MIMPKNFSRLMKSQTSSGRSRNSQLIFHSSSIAHSASTWPLRNAFSSALTLSAMVRKKSSGGPPHLEPGLRPDFKKVAPAAGADDRARQRGLIAAVLDHGLVDVDGDDLAEGEPGLHLLAIGALQLDDLRHLAFERDRAFRDPGTLTRLLGAAVSPEILNSLTSWATWAAVAFICCAKSIVPS